MKRRRVRRELRAGRYRMSRAMPLLAVSPGRSRAGRHLLDGRPDMLLPRRRAARMPRALVMLRWDVATKGWPRPHLSRHGTGGLPIELADRCASLPGRRDDYRCGFADGTACACTGCPDAGGAPCEPLPAPQWDCQPPPARPCPPVAPNAGTTCATEQLACAYGQCGIIAECENGFWAWSANPRA